MPGKKITLAIVALLSLLWAMLDLIGVVSLCGGTYYGTCINYAGDILFSAMILLPILFLGCIIYFLNDRIFASWQKFTFLWAPLSFVLVILASDAPSFFFPSAQEMLGMLVWGLYVLISLAIIIRGFLKPGKK